MPAIAFPLGASAQIGSTIEDCKAHFGAVVDTYRYDEGRATEYEFQSDGLEVLVVPLHDRVARITLSSKAAFPDAAIPALLAKYSNIDHWKPKIERAESVARAFPELIPDFSKWRYFITDDGTLYAALYEMAFSATPHKLTITTKDFQSKLKTLPPAPIQ